MDGYRELPDDWADQRADLAEVALAIQSKYAFLEHPAYTSIGDRWLTAGDLADLEGLSTARSDRYGDRPTPVAALIAAAREFGGDPAIVMQEGIADPPLRDGDRSIVFFRRTATDPARAPHDLEEVRDAVVADLRRKADYQRLLALTGSLEATARTGGLLAIALERGLDVQGITQVHIDSPSLLTFQLQNRLQA